MQGQVQRQAALLSAPVAAHGRHQGRRGSQAQRSAAAPSLSRQQKQRSLTSAAPTPARRAAQPLVVCKAGGEVLVAGATGQTAARIALQLAKSGYKVTAGVEDVAAAQEVLAVAKKLELLLPAEASAVKAVELTDLGDGEALAAALPKGRGARVVLVAGDTVDNRRVDPKQAQRAVDALAAAGSRVGQLVLVTQLGAPAGTGFFGFGASKPRPDALSKLEEQVVNSGLNYLIVRTAPSDRVPDSYSSEASPVVAGLGELPQGLSIARSQVASAVEAALSSGVGGDAIIEVGADPAAVAVPLVDQVQQVLIDAAAAARAQRAEQTSEEEEEEKPAPRKPAFSFGTQKIRAGKAQAVEEEEVEEVAAPAPKRGLFGTQRIVRSKQEEAAVAVEEKLSKRAPAFSFGTTKRGKQQVEEEEEEAPKPAPKRGGGLFGSAKQAAPAKAATAKEEKPAPRLPKWAAAPAAKEAAPAKAATVKEEKPAPRLPKWAAAPAAKAAAPAKAATAKEEKPATARGGLFAASRTTRQAEPEQPAPAKVRRGRAPLAAPEESKPARAATAKQQKPAAEEPKKKGGFLSVLGIGQETAYVDEL